VPANDAEGEPIQNQTTAASPTLSSLGDREHRPLMMRVLSIPEIGILLPLLALCGIVTALNPTFYAPDNVINILRSMSYTGLIAVPMTYVFVAGGLDLSVGSVAGLAGVIAGLAMRGGMPIAVSVLLGLLVGVAAGLINGVLAVQLRIPAFIVTLGMLSVARGIIYILTQGDPVYPLPKAFSDFGDATWLRLPYSVLLLAAVSVWADFVLRKTTYGHAIYAVGGNEEVARLAGIPVKRIKISTYVLVAFASAASGILLAARLGSAAAAGGQGWEMIAISAVILGGTSMFGGVGTILGVMLGAAIMAVLSNGMVLIGVSPYWQNVVLGVILVLAVGLDQLRRSRLGR
jgi:ribose/xylose/arabinose/galactoside ABC-type transport system permease subunit